MESPKEMFGKEGEVYKLSTDMDPSGWNSRGWEGHLCSRGSEVTCQTSTGALKWYNIEK